MVTRISMTIAFIIMIATASFAQQTISWEANLDEYMGEVGETYEFLGELTNLTNETVVCSLVFVDVNAPDGWVWSWCTHVTCYAPYFDVTDELDPGMVDDMVGVQVQATSEGIGIIGYEMFDVDNPDDVITGQFVYVAGDLPLPTFEYTAEQTLIEGTELGQVYEFNADLENTSMVSRVFVIEALPDQGNVPDGWDIYLTTQHAALPANELMATDSLAAGEMDTEVSIGIQPQGDDGIATLPIHVYDEDYPTDFYEVVLTLDVDANSVGEGIGVMHPQEFSLAPVYPNPFNSDARVSFTVPHTGQVEVTVHDITGRQIMTLADAQLAPGRYVRSFNAESLASGVYMIRMHADGRMFTQRATLVK